MIKKIIDFLKRFFKRIDYSGKFNAVDVALYLVYLSVKKEKYLSINQLIQLLYLIQNHYLKEKKFALIREDFIITNKGRLELKKVNDYFCGFGVMDLFYQYSNLKEDCKILKEYQIELEQLFDNYIDKVKSGEFKKDLEELFKIYISSFDDYFVLQKNEILQNRF